MSIDLKADQTQEIFAYLDAVRESGSINMFGAAPYVAAEFGLNRREANDYVLAWIKNFGKR